MPAKLKYKDKIEALGLSNCPSVNSTPKDCKAFRWCYEQKENPDTWITQAEKLERDRKFPRKNSSDTICDALGLSFFDSESNAKQTWKIMSPKIKAILGYKAILAGKILNSDGLCTPVSSNGHFNLHEFEDCDLNPRFHIFESL